MTPKRPPRPQPARQVDHRHCDGGEPDCDPGADLFAKKKSGPGPGGPTGGHHEVLAWLSRPTNENSTATTQNRSN
jgi:hypothetical protein